MAVDSTNLPYEYDNIFYISNEGNSVKRFASTSHVSPDILNSWQMYIVYIVYLFTDSSEFSKRNRPEYQKPSESLKLRKKLHTVSNFSTLKFVHMNNFHIYSILMVNVAKCVGAEDE